MGLVARALESAGIPTVVVGSALDIIEHCGVPRYLFVDFPLGNPCGRPYDAESQAAIMAQAFNLFEQVEQPGETITAPFIWDESSDWKTAYMHVGPDNVDALRAAGDRRRQRQAHIRQRKS